MRWTAGRSRNSHLYEVWLDGQRQPLAIAADIHLGYVERYRTDAAGEILRNPLAPHRSATEILYGAVELRRCNDETW
jgi:hypothetical protein